MITTTRGPRSRRVKTALATGLLALALAVGAGAGATETSAAAPQPGAGSGTIPTTGPTLPTVGPSAVAKPKSTAKPKPKPQPPVLCFHFTQEETILMGGEDPGPGGFTNCIFESEWG